MSTLKILKAGLIAGIIICISAASMVPVVGNQMDEVLAKFDLPPLSIASMVYFFFVSICLGIMLMWLYSLLFPKFKSRIKTLVISSLIIWFPGNCLASLANVVYGFMPLQLTIIGIIWGFGEIMIGGLLANKLIKV